MSIFFLKAEGGQEEYVWEKNGKKYIVKVKLDPLSEEFYDEMGKNRIIDENRVLTNAFYDSLYNPAS